MGEYAKHNGQQVKIGTCEDMYYLRIEDAHLVQPMPNSLDAATCEGLRFRLPFPDEDSIQIGHYEQHSRGYRMYRMVDGAPYQNGKPTQHVEDYSPAWLADAQPGSIQVSHPSGLLFSVPCHHGVKLPAIPGINFHWNGKTHSMELQQVKRLEDGSVAPIVGCRHCGTKWRDSWANVLPYVADPELRARLMIHASEAETQSS